MSIFDLSENITINFRDQHKLQELIDDPQALVFVLIDEVESLTAARQSMSGSEPSDAVSN